MVAALAGCSFGSDSGDAEFIKEADAICAQHERQISLIPAPQTFLRDFAVFMQRAVPIAREQNEKLRALETPEDDAADFRRMIGLMDQQLDLWEQAGRQAFDGNEAQARETFGQSSGGRGGPADLRGDRVLLLRQARGLATFELRVALLEEGVHALPEVVRLRRRRLELRLPLELLLERRLGGAVEEPLGHPDPAGGHGGELRGQFRGAGRKVLSSNDLRDEAPIACFFGGQPAP